jgi:hypothetical protein
MDEFLSDAAAIRRLIDDIEHVVHHREWEDESEWDTHAALEGFFRAGEGRARVTRVRVRAWISKDGLEPLLRQLREAACGTLAEDALFEIVPAEETVLILESVETDQ